MTPLIVRPRPTRRPRQTRLSGPVPWSVVAIGAGSVVAGLYVAHGLWTATRVHVRISGVEHHAILTSDDLARRTVTFTVHPTRRLPRASLRVDGHPLPDKALTIDADRISWRPGDLPGGGHQVVLKVPRPGLGPSVFRLTFTVDDTPPSIDVPALLPPAAICSALTIRGTVEPGAVLTADGRPVATTKAGAFTLRYPTPPESPIQLDATDRAGNRNHAEVVTPVRYPGGQGVHVSATGWAFEPLRRDVLNLVSAGLVSTVELDLKDESGTVGYDSKVPLARQIGAVDPHYELADAVAQLEHKGVRVIGRIVAFNDPVLTDWAWTHDHRDWVVQTPTGQRYPGTFANHANPDVERYNIQLAVEAANAGVHDILWDYVRRPEGDPEGMWVPGMKTSSSDAIVGFLTAARAALRPFCAYQGASVFGIAAERPATIGQDVPRIARHVDYIAPMLYPSHWSAGEYDVRNPNAQPYDIVSAALADFQAKVDGTGVPLMPWLQDFSLGYPYGPAEVRAQIQASADRKVPDWLLWNASVTYTSSALDRSLVKVRS